MRQYGRLMGTWARGAVLAAATVWAWASSPSMAQEAKKEPAAGQVTIRWFGQSLFQIETTRGTKIACDPHAIEQFGRQIVEADVVTVSHLHSDHTQLSMIADVQRAKVFLGLKPGGKNPDWNPVDVTFRDVKIRTVPTYHDETNGLRRGKNSVFVFEFDGLTVAHLGDLGHVLDEEQVKAIGRVDVLMIPTGGIYTINGGQAREVVEQLKPRLYILPMHYGTKDYTEVLPLDEFIDEYPNVLNLAKQGSNQLSFSPRMEPPKVPPIVILSHTSRR